MWGDSSAARDASSRFRTNRTCECLESRRLLWSPGFDSHDQDGHEMECGAEFDERFVLDPREWPQPGGDGTPVFITYGYSNALNGGLAGVTPAQVRDSIEEALQLWTAVAPLRIEFDPNGGNFGFDDGPYNTVPPRAQILIGHHLMDGPMNNLAHAGLPPPFNDELAGDLHFDSAEAWDVFPAPVDMIYVATHEIGHSLGMLHEPLPPGGNLAIMNPGFFPRFAGPGSGFLFPDDINGIRAKYGAGLGYVLDDDGTLHVSGTEASDNLFVSVNDFSVTVTSDLGNFSRSSFGVTSLVINARGGGDQIDIQDNQFPPIPIVVNCGAGDDAVNVGDGRLDVIQGLISVNGQSGADRVTLDDSDAIANAVYDVTIQNVQRPGFGGLFYGNVEALNLEAAWAVNNVVNVHSTAAATGLNVFTGVGSDLFFIGDGNLDLLPGPVQIVADLGNDLAIVNDEAANFGDGYFINEQSVQRPRFGALSYSNVEGLVLNEQVGGNVIGVNGTFALTPVTINANNGTDTVNVPSTTAPVNVSPSNGDDIVNVGAGGGFARVLFPGTQRLGQLNIGNIARATVLPGGDKVLTVLALAIQGAGTLDLADNDLILEYAAGSPLGAVQGWINAARHGGAWDGPGITSSTADANPSANTTLGAIESADYLNLYGAGTPFSGQPIDATAVLVKYTYYGDTDFNGLVDGDDYARTDAGFNLAMSGWFNGDGDGNGFIDGDDYALIDLAFNSQSSVL
jgi:hypothetical protein